MSRDFQVGGNESEILVEKIGQIAVLTLNRPSRANAWTSEMETRYLSALAELDDDGNVRALVVTGAGKSYCPGADVGNLEKIGEKGANLDEGAGAARPVTATLAFRKPVIAAINGSCAGIGLAQALACDVRFAAAGAKLTTAYARRGLVAEDGVSWLLPRIVGEGRARELLLSGRSIVGREALDLGLVHYVYESDELLGSAVAYASELAGLCSPRSMAGIKQQLWRHAPLSLEEAIADSWRMTVEALKQSDFREGVASFVERRQPSFDALPARSAEESS
jgi:enoyl-CoA hydratase/carnithine racemase